MGVFVRTGFSTHHTDSSTNVNWGFCHQGVGSGVPTQRGYFPKYFPALACGATTSGSWVPAAWSGSATTPTGGDGMYT